METIVVIVIVAVVLVALLGRTVKKDREVEAKIKKIRSRMTDEDRKRFFGD